MNRRELLAAGAVGLGGAWGLACGSRQPKPVDFAEVTRVYQAKDYDDVHARWTRHGKLIRDIGTVLEVWATYKSWDFRQAYIEVYSELYGVPESERRLLRQAQLEAARASYEFHVIAQSTEHDWNNLHEEDTVWKITLADAANREVAPTSVKLEKLPPLYEMRFFPNRTYFSRSYTIKFPRTVEGERRFTGSQSGLLLFRVAGPLGRVEASWQGNPA